MVIKDIKITNFKSLYGEHYFNFNDLTGLIKLSGPIGSGKTSLSEAIIYGLFGNVKTINNSQLIAWGAKQCQVELNIISKNKEIYIKRNSHEPLIITCNGKTIAASNKKDTQQILEDEIYDIPKLAVNKMCIISFNNFGSLAAMNPSETKQFLDQIFGFKLFSDFNNEIAIERKTQLNENIKLHAVFDENEKQIQYLNQKKINQQNELKQSIDIDKFTTERNLLIEDGKLIKKNLDNLQIEYKNKDAELYRLMTECATLGRQEKNFYNTFKSGKCPTCGKDIDESDINVHKEKMLDYANKYNEYDKQRNELKLLYDPKFVEYNNQISEIRDKINAIDSKVNIYKNNLQLINENYDQLISEYEEKSKELKLKIDEFDREIGEWNDMSELFTKTLRYNLLETLIPHINKAIQYFINKMDQQFTVKYDQEFKAHIFVDTFDKEISYSSLSTGQKKSLDMAIIFGILQNIVSNINFNIIFLDELFSNLDSDSRNIMLSLLKETLGAEKSIFVVNHAEMNDDYFNHKIRVKLENKKIKTKKDDELFIKTSKYEQIF